MTRVARPTTLTDKMLNRLILVVGLALLIGIALFALLYWNDRHTDTPGTIADQAVAAAEAAVQTSPNDLKARDYLAAAYISAGRIQEGIDQFTKVLQVSATDRPALLGRAIAYVKTEQLDAAEADLQKFIDDNGTGEFAKTDPQLEHAYYQLGVVQLQKGNAGDAVTTLTKAIAIDGGDADALYTLGQALNKTGDATKAAAALRLAAAFVPTGWCDPYRELGVSYATLRQPDGVAWSNGMVAFCEGRLSDAATELKALTSGSMKTDALLGLGYVTAQQGDNAGAARYFQQVLAIDPANRSASIALSSIGAKTSVAPSAAASPTTEGSN